MLLSRLREEVLEANLELVRRGLVLFTFGNASGISREDALVVIKPSGIPYQGMKPADLVVTDLNGKIVEGVLRPSSDLPTHIILYKAFPQIGGVSHTHSEYATAGPGSSTNSLLRHYPRGLFSWARSRYPTAERSGNRECL